MTPTQKDLGKIEAFPLYLLKIRFSFDDEKAKKGIVHGIDR